MICEVCRQNNADIIFKTVTGNQVATKAMCMSCANNMQQDMIKMFMALGFKKEQVEEPHPAPEPGPSMPRYVCTGCGRPFDKLDDQTMAGCSACYDVMREDLMKRAMLSLPKDRELQQPEKENKELPYSDNALKELRCHLMEAVVSERYEEAAILRDKIALHEQDQT